MGKRGPPPRLVRKLANEQIKVLLDLADHRIKGGNEELARRYVELVQAISLSLIHI